MWDWAGRPAANLCFFFAFYAFTPYVIHIAPGKGTIILLQPTSQVTTNTARLHWDSEVYQTITA
jgi:hypothetical protein